MKRGCSFISYNKDWPGFLNPIPASGCHDIGCREKIWDPPRILYKHIIVKGWGGFLNSFRERFRARSPAQFSILHFPRNVYRISL